METNDKTVSNDDKYLTIRKAIHEAGFDDFAQCGCVNRFHKMNIVCQSYILGKWFWICISGGYNVPDEFYILCRDPDINAATVKTVYKNQTAMIEAIREIGEQIQTAKANAPQQILLTCPQCGGSNWIHRDDGYECAACGEFAYPEDMCSKTGDDVATPTKRTPSSIIKTPDGTPDEVTEVCPNCEAEVTMVWDVKQDGYQAFCPYCGKQLMLCDACRHDGPDGKPTSECDYCSETDSCKHNPASRAPAAIIHGEEGVVRA